VRAAVLSNFDHRLPPLLDDLGIVSAFEFVLLPTQTGTAKPDRAFFEAALARLALPATRVVYVGDDPTDDHAGAVGAQIESIDVRELASLTELLPRLAGATRRGG
jgi:putative hydrolase of the HAD superfamily